MLAPILSSYSIFAGLDLGIMCLTLLVPIMYLLYPVPLKWPKLYLAFFIYVILNSLIVLGNVPVRVLLYSFVLFGGCMYLEKESFVKIYERVILICSAFFIVQLVFQVFFGRNIPGIFNILPTIYGDERDVVELQISAQRLSSFFLEPSYFAQYLFPYLCINLLAINTTKGIYKSVFVSVILLLLRSGVGLGLLAIVWMFWFFNSKQIGNSKNMLVLLLTFIPVSILIIKTDLYEYVISRSSELSVSENAGDRFMSSGFQRFLNGYFIYDNLSPFNKIFGINPEELKRSVFYSGSFLNGLSSILIMEGALGLILFIPHIVKLFYHESIVTKVFVICIVFLLISEAYFVTCRMQFAMVIAYTYSFQRNKIKTRTV